RPRAGDGVDVSHQHADVRDGPGAKHLPGLALAPSGRAGCCEQGQCQGGAGHDTTHAVSSHSNRTGRLVVAAPQPSTRIFTLRNLTRPYVVLPMTGAYCTAT